MKDIQLLDDLYSFDPATMTWSPLPASEGSIRPSARFMHGFTSTAGKLYVHGGTVYPGLPDPKRPGECVAASRGDGFGRGHAGLHSVRLH
jgi:hypothetical protein